MSAPSAAAFRAEKTTSAAKHKVEESVAHAKKEAHSAMMKDSNLPLGTRISAGASVVSDAWDESSARRAKESDLAAAKEGPKQPGPSDDQRIEAAKDATEHRIDASVAKSKANLHKAQIADADLPIGDRLGAVGAVVKDKLQEATATQAKSAEIATATATTNPTTVPTTGQRVAGVAAAVEHKYDETVEQAKGVLHKKLMHWDKVPIHDRALLHLAVAQDKWKEGSARKAKEDALAVATGPSERTDVPPVPERFEGAKDAVEHKRDETIAHSQAETHKAQMKDSNLGLGDRISAGAAIIGDKWNESSARRAKENDLAVAKGNV